MTIRLLIQERIGKVKSKQNRDSRAEKRVDFHLSKCTAKCTKITAICTAPRYICVNFFGFFRKITAICTAARYICEYFQDGKTQIKNLAISETSELAFEEDIARF